MANEPTEMQLAFIRHYVNDPRRNATRAARRAGYEAPRQSGYELLRLPAYSHIQALIKEQQQSYIQVFEEDIHAWYDHFKSIRDFRKKRVFDESGEFLGFHGISASDDRCIEEVNVKEFEGGRSFRLKARSSTAAGKLALEYYKAAKTFAGDDRSGDDEVNRYLEEMMAPHEMDGLSLEDQEPEEFPEAEPDTET